MKKLIPHLFWLALYTAFLYPLMTLSKGFIQGDYGVQFFPWSKIYADALAHGFLPLWTPLIQSGFPLFAEGQTGMLYLPNLILFKLLPLTVAYNGIFLIHFLMGGVFAYIYALRLKMSLFAAVFTAIIFTFGSTYAGCFYNIVTLRTVVWFPFMLYLIETYMGGKRGVSGFALAFVIGQVCVAGFPQMAAYALGISAVYYLVRCIERYDFNIRNHFIFVLSICLGLLTALPQIWATLDFASHSSRTLLDKSAALWGSFAPWSLSTLLWYRWSNFLSTAIYIGILPLFLIFLAPPGKQYKTIWVMCGFSFFMALGAFNPFYHILIHLPIASLLRNPSKFMFFTVFFLAVIAGFAYDKIVDRVRQADMSAHNRMLLKGIRLWSLICLIGLSVSLFSRLFSGLLMKYGEWYVRHFVLGKSHHRHSIENYLDKLHGLLNNLHDVTSIREPFFWLPMLFGGFALIALYACTHSKFRNGLPYVLLALLSIDFYIYGASGYGTGFLGNVKALDKVSTIQKTYPSDGRWLSQAGYADPGFTPNANMLTGHSHLGAYSPLISRDYYRLVYSFGSIDDSFSPSVIDPRALSRSRGLVNFLGLKYAMFEDSYIPEDFGVTLFSSAIHQTVFENPDAMNEFNIVNHIRLIGDEDARVQYLLSNTFTPRDEVVLSEDVSPGINQSKALNADVKVLEQNDQMSRLVVRSSAEAILVRNQVFDAGWKVYLNGKAQVLRRVNHAFQGILIPAGESRVEFNFEPSYFTFGIWFYLGGMLLSVAGFSFCLFRSRCRI